MSTATTDNVVDLDSRRQPVDFDPYTAPLSPDVPQDAVPVPASDATLVADLPQAAPEPDVEQQDQAATARADVDDDELGSPLPEWMRSRASAVGLARKLYRRAKYHLAFHAIRS